MYRQTPNRNHNQDSNMKPPKIPDRPLVPYMRFSKKTWPKVRAEHPDSPLWDLGKVIGQLWNSTPPAEKQVYHQEYEAEKVEYEKAMKIYNASYAQFMAAKSRAKAPQPEKTVSGRKGMSDQNAAVTGVFIQPVDDEEPFEMAGKRLAAIRYDRNNRLMAELFSPNYMPDPRTFFTPQRIENFRRQGQSLEQHLSKQNDEIAKLEEFFNYRKRAIEEASAAYGESLKRVCEEKPQLDQARYNKIAEEHGEQLLANWKVYEEKQAAIQAKLEADRRANPVLSDLITSKSPVQHEGGGDIEPTKTAAEGGNDVKQEGEADEQNHNQMEEQDGEVEGGQQNDNA